jgi:hypothetical protein
MSAFLYGNNPLDSVYIVGYIKCIVQKKKNNRLIEEYLIFLRFQYTN